MTRKQAESDLSQRHLLTSSAFYHRRRVVRFFTSDNITGGFIDMVASVHKLVGSFMNDGAGLLLVRRN